MDHFKKGGNEGAGAFHGPPKVPNLTDIDAIPVPSTAI
jgi:hypothetical protein